MSRIMSIWLALSFVLLLPAVAKLQPPGNTADLSFGDLEHRFRRELDQSCEISDSDDCFREAGITSVPVLISSAADQRKAGYERPEYNALILLACRDESDALKVLAWYEEHTRVCEKTANFLCTDEMWCDAEGVNLIARNGNVLMIVQYVQGDGCVDEAGAIVQAGQNRKTREASEAFFMEYAPKLIGVDVIRKTP